MPLDVELPVLRGFLTPSERTEWSQNVFTNAESGSLLESLMDWDLEAVLLSPLVLDLVSGDCEEGEELEHYLERRVLDYLDSGPNEDQTDRELAVLVVAVCCLHLFAQSNWTGPPLTVHLTDSLPPNLHSSQPLVESIHSSLLLDGESVYSLVSNPELLLLARIILTKCSTSMDNLQLVSWWTLRYVSLHQQILEARSEKLLELSHCCMEKVLNLESLLSTRMSSLLHLECVYLRLTFYEYQAAKDHIRRAQDLSGLDVNMTGALGKRTHFQHSFLPQLILEVKRKQEVTEDETSPKPTQRDFLPKDLSLGDDTVLDQINLQDPDQYQLPDLSAEEQAVLLGVCYDFQKNNPVHKLTEEELLAFTSSLLVQPKFWSVEVTALCLRTKLERGSSRRVERAMMQTQAIVDHFEDKSCPVSERLKMFYSCQAPPRWTVQKQLASLLMDLGCTSSALLLYQKLQMWEDVVICYERLGQHGKAEEIVRLELEKKETPSLYCLLGDILREHRYYDLAWELSGQRSARAMRSKALLHLKNKEFQLGVDCFEKSLQINGMQLGVWFSLGCAYFALEHYEGAAKAFQRCVGLEPDNAEAWNNLSTAYIRLQRKNKAFLTLQEALKCNYEQWQIWENFIVVSTDVGEFSDAIKAYHRLMDLRDSYKDVQILQILVRAVVEDLQDRQGDQARGLGSRMKELLGRVTSRHSSDGELWLQYALLYGGGRGSTPEDNDKALQFLMKAHRCKLQTAGWEKEPRLFKEVLERAVSMGEVTISCSKEKSNPAESLQMISSTRLSLKSLASKAKQLHVDVSSGQIHPELQDGVAALEKLVSELQELSTKLRDQSQ